MVERTVRDREVGGSNPLTPTLFPVKSTLRLLAIAAILVVAATRVFAAQAEISGIERVYLRAGPGSDQPTLGVLSAGDPVDIIDIEGSWTKVQTPDGKVGFVYHRYVTPRVGDQIGANQRQIPSPLRRCWHV